MFLNNLQRQGISKQNDEKTNVTKSFLCKIGLHKSDRDFGIRWHDKMVISSCVRCNTNITHPRMKSFGGGAD